MAGQGRLAQEFRTGLSAEVVKPAVSAVVEKDPLSERLHGKTIRHHLVEFGHLFGLIGLLAVIVGVRKGHSWEVIGLWASLASIFIYLGYKAPQALYYPWKGWMAFADKLSIVMTAVLMSITWFLMVTPIAIFLKLIGKKVMNCTYKENVPTYWDNRDPKLDDFKLLERMF